MKRKPNWRNPKDYPRTDGLTPSQWAWEFLRRDPEYKESWERYLDALGALSEDPDPRPIPDELSGAWMWGIDGFHQDPDEDSPPKWLPAVATGHTMQVKDRPPNRKGYRTVGQLFPDHEGRIPVVFNLRQPIKPQLDAARKQLLRLQEKAEEHGIRARKVVKPQKKGHKGEQWPGLLRVLDAVAEGAAPKEIAEILFPARCPVDEAATECPLGKPGGEISAKDMKKCPLGEEASGDEECPLEVPFTTAGAGKVGDKHTQALRFASWDYRSIIYSDR